MRRIYQLLNLIPAPLFALGLIYNLVSEPQVCGHSSWEMTVMWAIMTVAHLSPWIIWWQQRDFTRNA